MTNKWAISPSELAAAVCARRHVFRYVLKLDRDDANENRESAAFGDRVHNLMERWVRDATPIDQETQEGKVAASMLQWAPNPRTGNPEGKIRFEVNGITYGGRYDWSGLDGQLSDNHDEGDIPVILDYKTSTRPEEYGMWTKEEFLRDPAAILYAANHLSKNPAPVILLRWLYAKARKGKVKAEGDVRTIEQGAEMITRFYPARLSNDEFMSRGIRPMAKEGCARASDMLLTYSEVETAYVTHVEPKARHVLNVLRHETNPLRLDANLSECSAYGGCPHQHRCAPTLTDRQKIEAGFRREYIDTMGLAGSLLKGLQGQNVTPTTGVMLIAAGTPAPAFSGFKGFNPPEVSNTPTTVVPSLGIPSGFGTVTTIATMPVKVTSAPAAAPIPSEPVAAPVSFGSLDSSDADLGRAVRTLMEAWARTASAQGLK